MSHLDVAEGALADVAEAVGAVCDPEYPDLSIAQLGIFERVRLEPGEGNGKASRLIIELVPTILGCPALEAIRADVTKAARAALTEPSEIEVRFLTEPAWSPSRISESAKQFLANEYTIAVRTRPQVPACPSCGAVGLEHRSDFGPTPCRSIYWCPSCRNPVEVIGKP